MTQPRGGWQRSGSPEEGVCNALQMRSRVGRGLLAIRRGSTTWAARRGDGSFRVRTLICERQRSSGLIPQCCRWPADSPPTDAPGVACPIAICVDRHGPYPVHYLQNRLLRCSRSAGTRRLTPAQSTRSIRDQGPTTDRRNPEDPDSLRSELTPHAFVSGCTESSHLQG